MRRETDTYVTLLSHQPNLSGFGLVRVVPKGQSQACGVKAPIVTPMMPEVIRSRPGQDEARGNSRGGPTIL